MAYARIDSKVAVPFRTTEGHRHLNAPINNDFEEIKNLLPGCVNCSRRLAHDPCETIGHRVPVGTERWAIVPEERRLRRADVDRLNYIIWLAGYIHHPSDNNSVIYNAGAGNNQTQRVDYKIISSSGNVLTIRGPNPKRLVIGRSQVNPDWPEEGGYFTNDTVVISMMVGAQVYFNYPSVLEDKLEPFIKKIDMPESEDDEVTFDIHLSKSVNNAMTHYDEGLATGSDVYSVRVYMHVLQPETYPNTQVGYDDQWSFRTMRFSRTELEEEAVIPLRTTQGGNSRVLYPFMMPVGVAFQVMGRKPSGEIVWRDDEWITERLTTIQTGELLWESSIDLSDLLTEEDMDDCTNFQISFRPSATATDSMRTHGSGACSKTWLDVTGSYVHKDGRRCAAVYSSGFENYEAKCWQPVGAEGTGCDQFSLGDETDYVGPNSPAVADVKRRAYWGPLFVRSQWVLEQSMPSDSGSRNFNLVLPSGGGTSLMSLCGSWSDTLPEGKYAYRSQFYAPAFGIRSEVTGPSGKSQILTHGLYFARGTHTMGTNGVSGILPRYAFGWNSRKDCLGVPMSQPRSRYPRQGAGRCHLYDWTYSGGASQVEILNNQQLFCTALPLESLDVVEELNEEIQARFS